MNKSHRFVSPVSAALLLLVALTSIVLMGEGTAWAYIDPGTGAMMWQLMAAALAMGAYGVNKLLRAFGLRRGQQAHHEETETEPEEQSRT